MKSKGVIFDFNGVLWWDSELQEESWRGFSTQLRGDPLTEAEVLEHVHGRTNGHTIEYLVGHPVEQTELNTLVQQKESIYRDLCLAQGNKFTLSPGSIELFNFLVQHHIPHTIATGSERVNLEFFFSHFGLDQWFDMNKVVYDDGVTPGKPAPDIYLKAASLIDLNPSECMVIEDASSGIKAAQSAGIGKIVALGPAERHQDWLTHRVVSKIIQSLQELNPEAEFEYS